MKLRGLWLATAFLTRVPVPRVANVSPLDLSRSAAWFPVVGCCIGGLVWLTVVALHPVGAFLAAVAGVAVWVWLTGALHLDGLADLADALGASHGDPQRFLEVLDDPRHGTFGVLAVLLVVLLKTAVLFELSGSDWLALPLVLAWARLGPLAWRAWLPPLKPGQAEHLSRTQPIGSLVGWTATLFVASLVLAPVLCLAPLVIAGWGAWLRQRLRGMTGDCLGAGIELTEVALLLALVLAGNASGFFRIGA